MDHNFFVPAYGRWTTISLRLCAFARRKKESAAADGAGSRNAAGLAAKVVCLGGQMKGRQTNNSWLMDMVD
jgi:hypothetical protein